MVQNNNFKILRRSGYFRKINSYHLGIYSTHYLHDPYCSGSRAPNSSLSKAEIQKISYPTLEVDNESVPILLYSVHVLLLREKREKIFRYPKNRSLDREEEKMKALNKQKEGRGPGPIVILESI